MGEAVSGIKLHLGCGLVTPDGWINVDGSWNAWLAKHPWLRRLAVRIGVLPRRWADIDWKPNVLIYDLRKTLPWPDGSVSAVYAAHLLEHLYREEVVRLLRECHRVLVEPRGVLRVVVPDLRHIVDLYLEDGDADMMMERLRGRPARPPGNNLLFRLYHAAKDFHSHKWMYDAPSMMQLFRETGFVDVAQRQLFDSQIYGIQEVERESRVEKGAGIIIEGVKGANRQGTALLGTGRIG